MRALVALLPALLACTTVSASASPSVRQVLDLYSAFSPERATNALEASAISGATSGGVAQKAIFLHPLSTGEAVLSYPLSLPPTRSGSLLVLVFSIGLRDGFRFDEPGHEADGVTFRVRVDGRQMYQRHLAEQRWIAGAVDLSPYAGRAIRLSLCTDAGGRGNSNYDWALWGDPRVLQLSNPVRLQAMGGASSANVVTQAAIPPRVSDGVVALRLRSAPDAGALVAVLHGGPQAHAEPVASYSPLPDARADEWQIVCLDCRAMGDAGALLRVTARRPSEVSLRDAAVFPYPPELQLGSVAVSSPLVPPEGLFAVAVRLTNAGKGTFRPDGRTRVALRVQGGRIVGPRAVGVPVPTVPPGGEAEVRWRVRAGSGVPEVKLLAALGTRTEVATVPVVRRLPNGGRRAVAVARAAAVGDAVVVENDRLRLTLAPAPTGGLYGKLWAVRNAKPIPIGLLACMPEVIYKDAAGSRRVVRLKPQLRVMRGAPGAAGVAAVAVAKGSDGVQWRAWMTLGVRTGDDCVAARCSLAANRPTELLRFPGITLYAGEGGAGAAKTQALFPGLEYLEDGERSSSTRDAAPPINLRLVPHPYKVTVPLMAVEQGGAVAGLLWNQAAKWDGQHQCLSAIFASPNWRDGQNNHLMGLFLPAGPDFMDENQTEAARPYRMLPGQRISMGCYVLAKAKGTVLDATDAWYKRYGLPKPAPAPRSLDDEVALCRYGLMETTWDAATGKSRHCVGWAPANAPGFAVLLLSDYLRCTDATVRAALRQRVDDIVSQTRREEGPGGLASPANCHILRWELPFRAGSLFDAMAAAGRLAGDLASTQREDGAWEFRPTDQQHAALGRAGDAVLGTCAANAWLLMRYARITGDPDAMAAGLKALRYMERFRTPRGAQAWECPLYEPDILAAAYAVRAYVEGYEAAGDASLLAMARYWARTGLPFLYSWALPDRPGMLYASIPVFGTTFFTHSWFGVPVQWCGLVYAYGLQQLARYDRSFPWRQVAEGITVSACYQQWPDGQLKGTYPDGFYGFCTERGAPYLNPEDILVNVLALDGRDPDISTRAVRANGAGEVRVSSGATVSSAAIAAGRLGVRLSYQAGETSHTLVARVRRPNAVTAGTRLLLEKSDLDAAPEGWRYDPVRRWLWVKLRHASNDETLEVQLGEG